MVSNFQVQFGQNSQGITALQRVPVIYGDSSRQASTIIRQNSENSLNSVPAMAVYISNLGYDRERVLNPTFVDTMSVRERYFDSSTGTYSTQQGDVINVQRLMPVPYKLTLKLDIWTSNTEQKLQLLEQLTTLFNPALEIQSTDNYIDWTSITYILLTDVQWSSRSIPVGADTPIDVATLTFDLPIYISGPALIKKFGVIQKIIANIFNADGNIDEAIFNETNLMSKQYITPLQYGVILFHNQLQLVGYSQPVINQLGQQFIKQVTANVSANTTIKVDNSTGVEPGMIVSGISTRGLGTITANTASNVIVGNGTSFLSSLSVGNMLYSSGNVYAQLGLVANIVSNTQVKLSTTAGATVSNVGFDSFNPVTSGCQVLSVNGGTVITNNAVTVKINDRIAFNEVVIKEGGSEPWRNLINVYGNLIGGSSQILLEMADGGEVVGTVAYNPLDDTTLLWTPQLNTLPSNTLAPVNAIIDPQSSRPNKDLQQLANGTRYLLVNDYVSSGNTNPTYNWVGVDNTPLVAYTNDIIQYNGQHWFVSFNSASTAARNQVSYMTNMTTGIQYVWNSQNWAKSYEGFYPAGKWQLII
jgi:hypothetical protein